MWNKALYTSFVVKKKVKLGRLVSFFLFHEWKNFYIIVKYLWFLRIRYSWLIRISFILDQELYFQIFVRFFIINKNDLDLYESKSIVFVIVDLNLDYLDLDCLVFSLVGCLFSYLLGHFFLVYMSLVINFRWFEDFDNG